jgi:hypothetical protein
MDRPNFYILLDLLLDADEITIKAAIKRKREDLNKLRSNPMRATEASKSLAVLSQAEAVMLDPKKRRQEATDAQRERADKKKEASANLDRDIQLHAAKGYLTEKEFAHLVDKYKSCDFSKGEIRARITVPVGTVLKPTLEQSVADRISAQLRVLKKKNLYDFLGLPHDTRRAQLVTQARHEETENRRNNNKTAEVTATDALCGLCLKIFGTDDQRERYDNTLADEAWRSLEQTVTLAGEAERGFETATVEILVERAREHGLSKTEFILRLRKFAKDKGWTPPQTPSETYRTEPAPQPLPPPPRPEPYRRDEEQEQPPPKKKKPERARDRDDDEDARPSPRPAPRDEIDDQPKSFLGIRMAPAKLSMILGIASLASFLICGIIAPVLGILAIVSGRRGRVSGDKSQAQTGIVCGSISVGISTLIFSVYALILAANMFRPGPGVVAGGQQNIKPAPAVPEERLLSNKASNGKLLETAAKDVKTFGGRVQLRTLVKDSQNQRWQMIPFAENQFLIVCKSNGLALEANSENDLNANGCPVRLGTLTKAPNQQWRLEKAGEYVKITNKANGKLLEAHPNDLLKEGGSIHLWEPTKDDRCLWKIQCQ